MNSLNVLPIPMWGTDKIWNTPIVVNELYTCCCWSCAYIVESVSIYLVVTECLKIFGVSDIV